jgi:hypothetical protein
MSKPGTPQKRTILPPDVVIERIAFLNSSKGVSETPETSNASPLRASTNMV